MTQTWAASDRTSREDPLFFVKLSQSTCLLLKNCRMKDIIKPVLQRALIKPVSFPESVIQINIKNGMKMKIGSTVSFISGGCNTPPSQQYSNTAFAPQGQLPPVELQPVQPLLQLSHALELLPPSSVNHLMPGTLKLATKFCNV
jgi:hypothetical protein